MTGEFEFCAEQKNGIICILFSVRTNNTQVIQPEIENMKMETIQANIGKDYTVFGN